jgi:hypothetical protein
MTRQATQGEIKALDVYAKSKGFKDIYELNNLLLKAGKGSLEVIKWAKEHGNKIDLEKIIKEKNV